MLAGDAAHVHAVNGGQGLNTGIADAFALAWRLSAMLDAENKGVCGDRRMIQSYDTERRSVAQDVINVAARLVRDTVHTAKQYVGTIEKNAGYITGKFPLEGAHFMRVRLIDFQAWALPMILLDLP